MLVHVHNPDPAYDPTTPRVIEVVVHVIMDSSCLEGAFSDEMVASQIEILNEDFLALAGTPGANGTDAQIRFDFADADPQAEPTTGITRDNTIWFNDDGDYWETLAWDPHRYLNLYTNTASGARGNVPFLPLRAGSAVTPTEWCSTIWSSAATVRSTWSSPTTCAWRVSPPSKQSECAARSSTTVATSPILRSSSTASNQAIRALGRPRSRRPADSDTPP